MLKRLVLGLVLGLIIGGVIAVGLVQGLHVTTFATAGAVLAYVAAAVTGIVTGLVAGKPIWSEGGRIEAGLKAFFGALLAAGGMFALRTWAKVEVDLTALQAGQGFVGDLPAVSLPLVAAVLAGFFELDNTGGDAAVAKDRATAGAKGSGAAKSSGGGRKVRVGAQPSAGDDAELDEASSSDKKRAR